MKTRLERQLTNALLELLDHPEAARCRMEGCRVCPPIARQVRDVLTTVQVANAIDGEPTDRIARPHPNRRVPSSSPPSAGWRGERRLAHSARKDVWYRYVIRNTGRPDDTF